MLKIASLLYTIASTTMMGLFIIVALVAGYDTSKYIVIAVVAGLIVAIPVSYFVAKAIKDIG